MTTYALAASAEAAGYRACFQCRRYRWPPSVTWTGPELVCRAERLIRDGALEGATEQQLGARLDGRPPAASSPPLRLAPRGDERRAGLVRPRRTAPERAPDPVGGRRSDARSYGELGRLSGEADPREIGRFIATNPLPLIVRCHRVVAADGLGGYGGGLDLKRRLLELEGALPPRPL